MAAPTGATARYEDLEAPAEVMELVSYYSRHLAVPARRDPGAPEVLAGKRLFYEAGCTGCHTPKHATGRDGPDPALRGQLIWPYTDLLLHDMGEGLADGRPGRRGRRAGMAHGAALGHRPDRDRQRPHLLPARRAGAQPDRGDPLARRRGASEPRAVPPDAGGGSRRRSWPSWARSDASPARGAAARGRDRHRRRAGSGRRWWAAAPGGAAAACTPAIWSRRAPSRRWHPIAPATGESRCARPTPTASWPGGDWRLREPARPWRATRRPPSISGPTSTAPPAGSSPRPCATATRR